MGVGMAWKCLGRGDPSSGDVVEGLLNLEAAVMMWMGIHGGRYANRPGLMWRSETC